MSTPEQTNPQQPNKRPAAVKIVYGIVMAALVGLLLVSAFLYWQDMNPEQPELPSQETTAPAYEPTVPSTDAATEPSEPETPTTPMESVPPTEPEEPTLPEAPVDLEDPDKVDIRLNTGKSPVYLIGKAAQNYLKAEKVPNVTDFLMPYWETESRMDRGAPVKLSYKTYSLPKGVTVAKAVFRVFIGDGSGRFIELQAPKGSTSVAVYNLRTGNSYEYQAAITLTNGTELELRGSFRTAAGPRLMKIDGLVNVRDLGGWVAAGGKTVKQGLLYRGSEMDGAVEQDFKLTGEGLKQLQALGIKTDLDLRHEGADVIPGAEHIYYDAIQYEHAFTPAGREAVRKLFADLADPANYPAYLHCTYGADRTGTMCYLLLGLLGVSAADLMRDYELTALYYGYVSPEQMGAFVAKIAELPGNTTQEKIEYFLLSTGVTEQQIGSIRQIFLG